jgi:Protein of unknown function (DUF3501)
MNPVELSEIKNIADYEIERITLRPVMMALKDRRRIRVGAHMTFLFENRETVRYQIQEMTRIERTVDIAAIRHEVETYNELIPRRGELSASMLVEYDSAEERAVALHDLLGLEHHVWFAVADLPPSQARFDTRQMSTERISSVQYVKFPLTPDQCARWSQGGRLVIDHPKYNAEAVLTPEQLRELAGDFA